MIKSSTHTIKGIQRDLTVSKFSSEFAFDAQNIRITARDHNTLLSITNEKGNKEIILKDANKDVTGINGTVIGYNVLNEYVTLFTTDIKENKQEDTIYRLTKKEDTEGKYFECIVLYKGNLKFDVSNPIESLGVFENNDIQKVYWIDGKNQARVINITSKKEVRDKWNDNSFDFIQKLKLQEEVSVQRLGFGGTFAAGIIQYAFSYYNLYGQESNIFYTTPINYISYKDRGASPEDKISNSFKIKLTGVDDSFDFLRIYSIHRTSIDAVPTVTNVADITINNTTIEYTDTGTTGVTIDPTELLYIGGEEIVPKTITSKDSTLFLGNITLKNSPSREFARKLKGKDIIFNKRRIEYDNSLTGYYSYNNHLSNPDIRGFKHLDWYRFGLQFQRRDGKWSEAFFVKDIQNESVTPTPIEVVQAQLTLEKDLIDIAIEEGFVKVRGIMVPPTINDREVIAQGIVCPTVYNMEDRCSNSPFAQASWFTRPNLGVDDTMAKNLIDDWNTTWYNYNHTIDGKYYDIVNMGAWAEFRHNHPIPDNWSRNAEIQCLANVPSNPYTSDVSDNVLPGWISKNKEYFFIDQSIVTFHSPEIEFDTSISNLDLSDVKFRIVGRAVYTANASDIDIQTTTPQNSPDMPGVYKENVGVKNISQNGTKSLVSGMYYYDEVCSYDKTAKIKDMSFLVYPWHREGSLNNDISATQGNTRSAVLNKKKMSNLKFAGFTDYLPNNKIWYPPEGISGAALFDSDEKTMIKIKAPANSGLDDINYYGNVDRIIVPTRDSVEYEYTPPVRAGFETEFVNIVKNVKLNKEHGYPIIVGLDFNNLSDATDAKKIKLHNYFVSPPVPLRCLQSGKYLIVAEKNIKYTYGVDPVNIKYKSSPHVVIAFNYKVNENDSSKHNQIILPTLKKIGSAYSPEHIFNYVGGDLTNTEIVPWDKDCKRIQQAYIEFGDDTYEIQKPYFGYSWIAELYRDNVSNRFGGSPESAIDSNIWIPAGKPISLITGYNGDTPIPVAEPVDVYYTEGDTYYQRYDCLKTYPYTLEDKNSIVEIPSFYCETRINIDGRYDRNRGQTSNLAMNRSNFNKFNPVYNQSNNFFTAKALDYNKFSLNSFPNTITWTKEKQAASLVDTWTNITMASTLDLDGDKGEVVSLNTFNNEIYCFQKQGLSNILFNSRVQIPTSDGVPIEISNGLKVSGKRYISNSIGCNNKWSITETPSGLYFIDNITNSIYLFNSKIESLSDRLGFRQWLGENNSLDIWNPVGFNNFVTFYDKNNNDVYFVNKDTALVYSELLGQFTSFMSYGQVPAMFNINNDFYAIKGNNIWEQFAGDYNMFFGHYYPYSITFVSNADEPYDKIFNNIEFRADCWTKNKSGNEVLASGHTFDTLEVWNEYQKGVTSLTSLAAKPSPLKKKFRIWRANVPRANTDWNGIKANKMDRIRNTWAYVKLSMNKENTDRMEFHDMIVHYFV